jgi:hypothetical protein
VVAFQIFRTQPKRQSTVTPDLQPIIINGNAHRTTAMRVIPVAECINQCLSKRHGRKQRLIHAFENSRLYPPCYGQVARKEIHGFGHQLKCVPINLALIIELSFVQATELRQAQLTLLVVREKSPSKNHNCRIEYPPIGPESQAFEKIRYRSRDERIQLPRRDGALSSVLDLRGVEILDLKP